MNMPFSIGQQSGPGVRWLTLAALGLTATALLLCLQFVWRTTGGTLFLFSVLSPVLVLMSTAIVIGLLIHDYRRAHRLFEIERYAADRLVFRQGAEGTCAYFIRHGEVEVFDEQRSEVLARLGPGEYFGEMALLADAPRNATVRTVTDCELAVLGKHNFLNMMKLLPAAEDAILNTVRMRAMHGGLDVDRKRRRGP